MSQWKRSSQLAPTRPAIARWRNPAFVLVFAPIALTWLAAIGWLTWYWFHPATDWVGRQNEILQEILGMVLLLVWALLIGLGVGGAAFLAERFAEARAARR